ncbi:MAG: ABC transporter permease [Phycisphaerales bacterium]|jgi:putative ABC transport system permease protein
MSLSLFRLKRTFVLGLKSLWMHRLRSTLTTLGIVFGVSSVIAMLAIGEGASQHAREQIARLGSRNIIIKSVAPPEDPENTSSGQGMRQYGLTYADAERFRNSVPDVEVIVPVRRLTQRAWYRTRKITAEVIGTVPWYPEMAPVHLEMGRFLSGTDASYRQAVCVVDTGVVDELFRFDDALGQDIKVSGDHYRIVGIVSSQSGGATSMSGDASAAQDRGGANAGRIYIPLTTAKDRFGEISVQFGGGSGPNVEKVELQEIVVKVAEMEGVLPMKEILETLLKRFHAKTDYQIVVPLELLREAERTKMIFSIVLGSIAAISLLVGGIGIMNIMLATVSERTREIGIRRALGARKKDIIMQFLSETLLLTLAGGLLGILLGLAIPLLVTYFGHMPTVITSSSLILAFGISAGVGITFGLYPAYRAANMDPIESLRHE